MKRLETTIGGRAVRYYEAGDGTPVILLHGAGGTARLWRKQFGGLSSRFRLIAPDLPGFGGSEPDKAISGVRDYALFMREFMASLGIHRAPVVGSSMGGWAACWFAARFPEMVERLALISPAGLYDESDPPISVDGVVDEVTGTYMANMPPDNRKAMAELDRAIATIIAMSGSGGFTPDLAGVLGKISAPTLIVWGSEDRVIPPSYGRRFKDAIPGSSLVIIEGSGHMPQLDNPEKINWLLGNFLADGASS